jgi:hypothetical protein
VREIHNSDHLSDQEGEKVNNSAIKWSTFRLTNTNGSNRRSTLSILKVIRVSISWLEQTSHTRRKRETAPNMRGRPDRLRRAIGAPWLPSCAVRLQPRLMGKPFGAIVTGTHLCTRHGLRI